MKRMNNEMAVSPIVATLVLIVVAVIGAVAVGTIMGTFSTSVAKQANTNQAGSASQNEILVAGSTTVDPITQAAGTLYTTENPGVKVVSQATASGAGVQAVGDGVADIGAVSEVVKPAWTNQFPNLKQYQIGEGAIVLITNKANPAMTAANLSTAANGQNFYNDLVGVYNPTTASSYTLNAPWTNGTGTNSFTVVYRADGSGTADSFFKNYLKLTSSPTSNANWSSLAVNGNPMMVQTVGNTAYSIGFADYGDAVANVIGTGTVTILPAWDPVQAKVQTLPNSFDTAFGTGTTANWNDLRNEAKYIYQTTVEGQTSTASQTWPSGLIRPLIYLTNGQPSSSVQEFINYVQADPIETVNGNHYGVFQATNNYAIADIS